MTELTPTTEQLKSLVMAMHDESVEYFINYKLADSEEGCDRLFEFILQSEASCERFLAMLQGDNSSSGKSINTFSVRFEAFCSRSDQVGKWTNSLDAVRALSNRKAKKRKSVSESSTVATDFAFWIQLTNWALPEGFNFNMFMTIRKQLQGTYSYCHVDLFRAQFRQLLSSFCNCHGALSGLLGY